MPSWKVLISDGLDPQASAILESAGVQVDDREGIEAGELLDSIAEYDGLILRGRTKANAELIRTASKLKVIGRAGVGVDNIDLEAAKAQGVAVVHSPAGTSVAVAEHTLALMLALLRKIPQADARMKAGEWPKKELMGTELAGKVLGIAGVGKIGSLVARRAAAFDMQVLGYDPLLDDDAIEKRGAQPVSLDELFEKSNLITFHLPLNQDTRGMIDKKAINKMKPGVFILHAARGGVIDERALLAALNAGRVAGAALDVFEQEPPGASELVTHPNVVATPHIAAQTAEAQSRAAKDVAEEVLAALQGKPLRWRVA